MREDELKDLLGSFNDPDLPPPSPARLRGRADRRRGVRTGVTALAIVAIAGGAVALAGRPVDTVGLPASSASPSPSVAQRTAIVVPADPNLDLRCRKPGGREYDSLWTIPYSNRHLSPTVVDINDDYSVVAYWSLDAELETVLFRDGRVNADLPADWDGTVPGSGDMITDGPAAFAAVRSCQSAQVDPPEQARPSFTCEKPPTADLLRVQKSLWGSGYGDPTGGGMFVRGGTTPEGKPWLMYAVNTDQGVRTVLVQLPSPLYKGGTPARAEFSPLSDAWSGELAQFRGTVQWGVEGQEAAFDCLGG